MNFGQEPRKHFYQTSAYPLWLDCIDSTKSKSVSTTGYLQYLRKIGALNQTVGVPTSMYASGQQWDYPNAFAPFQLILVEALEGSGVTELQNEAFRLAEKWVHTNYRAFHETGAMFEKVRGPLRSYKHLRLFMLGGMRFMQIDE